MRAKVEGQEITVVDESGETAGVVDLMEALRQSVEASRSRETAPAEPAEPPKPKPRSRKKAS